MGSGSTGVACVNTNRDFIGIELDQEYYKIAKERIDENYITTLAEVLGAGLIIYGVYTINVSLALIVAGAFLIIGSYLTIR